jgi:hypothetical protein
VTLGAAEDSAAEPSLLHPRPAEAAPTVIAEATALKSWLLHPRSAEAAPTVPAEAPAANPWMLQPRTADARAAARSASAERDHRLRLQIRDDEAIARALVDEDADVHFPTLAEAADVRPLSRPRGMGPPPPRSARSGSRGARSQSRVRFREPPTEPTPPPSPSGVSAVPFGHDEPDAEVFPVEPSGEPAPDAEVSPVEPSGEPAPGVSAVPLEPSGESTPRVSPGSEVLNAAVIRLRSFSPRVQLADVLPALQHAFAETSHPTAPPETERPPASADVRYREPAPPQPTPPAAASALHCPGGAALSVDASSPNVADPRRHRDMLAGTVVAVAQAWGAPTNRDTRQHNRPAPRRGWHAESGYAPPDSRQLLIQAQIAASFNLDQALPLFSPLHGIPCGRQLCTPSPLTLRVE